VRRALEEPIRQIVENAGHEGSVVVEKVKGAAKPSQGLDAESHDDDEGFRTALRHLLTQGRHEVRVEEAADGDEALQRVATRRPDAVLMDLTMPRNGIEATRRLKVRWPNCPSSS
jgi:PleD family two-component response regulator